LLFEIYEAREGNQPTKGGGPVGRRGKFISGAAGGPGGIMAGGAMLVAAAGFTAS